jgi:hypothetical protein
VESSEHAVDGVGRVMQSRRHHVRVPQDLITTRAGTLRQQRRRTGVPHVVEPDRPHAGVDEPAP